jgi:hypothetical protein
VITIDPSQQQTAATKMNTISNHRFFQLYNLVDILHADARVNFRCAKKADSINNRGAATFFRARATKAIRVATIAALKAGL